MIQSQSKIRICDSSGVQLVRCITVLSRTASKRLGKPGSFFIGSVISCKSKLSRKFKKGNVVKCYFLFSKKENEFSSSGFFIKSVNHNFGAIVESSNKKYSIPFISKSRCCLSFHCSKFDFFDLNLSDRVIILFLCIAVCFIFILLFLEKICCHNLYFSCILFSPLLVKLKRLYCVFLLNLCFFVLGTFFLL
jgi:ribosomal protein L14